MTELTDQLEKMIQKAALDGALTEDAVAQFHTLVKERDALKDANEEWEVEGAKLRDLRDKLQSRIKIVEEECEAWAGKEQDLLDREKECHELEIRKECADLRVQDHITMFDKVFRNLEVRRNMLIPVAAPVAVDQYGNIPANASGHTEMHDEKTKTE